jgi:hypothetical protein
MVPADQLVDVRSPGYFRHPDVARQYSATLMLRYAVTGHGRSVEARMSSIILYKPLYRDSGPCSISSPRRAFGPDRMHAGWQVNGGETSSCMHE